MKAQRIILFGEVKYVACDRKCHKAWGINGRPKIWLSEDEDDHVMLPDSALGTAPGPGETMGISEGSDMKPSATSHAGELNRWCVRECERSAMSDTEHVELTDFERLKPNMPRNGPTS